MANDYNGSIASYREFMATTTTAVTYGLGSALEATTTRRA